MDIDEIYNFKLNLVLWWGKLWAYLK